VPGHFVANNKNKPKPNNGSQCFNGLIYSTGLNRTGVRLLSLSALLLGAALTVGQAQNITLTDGNSTTVVNPGALGGGSGALGMNSWTVNNVNQLAQQWFWFGLGSGGQSSIDHANTFSSSVSANQLTLNYGYNQNNYNFSIQIDYSLSGGLTGGNDWTSDIQETIKIQNNSSTTLPIRFYQYSNFTLNNDPNNQNVLIYDSGGYYTHAVQTRGLTQVSETIDNPLANHAEAGLTTDSPNTLYRLNNVANLQLNDVTASGPGDATWALEWEFAIGAGMSQDVFKDKQLEVAPVPEPATLGLLALGLVVVALRRQRSA
jgi:hypothetical protein